MQESTTPPTRCAPVPGHAKTGAGVDHVLVRARRCRIVRSRLGLAARRNRRASRASFPPSASCSRLRSACSCCISPPAPFPSAPAMPCGSASVRSEHSWLPSCSVVRRRASARSWRLRRSSRADRRGQAHCNPLTRSHSCRSAVTMTSMDATEPADFYTGIVVDVYGPLRSSTTDPQAVLRSSRSGANRPSSSAAVTVIHC